MLRRSFAFRSAIQHVASRSQRVFSRAKVASPFSTSRPVFSNTATATTPDQSKSVTITGSDNVEPDQEEVYQPQPLPSLSTLFPQSTKSNSTHNDLRSFLAYARRTNLDPTSTVYRGTRYEYLVLETLKRYGFELVRIGGRGDLGWDLVGYWTLPFNSTSVARQSGNGALSGEDKSDSDTTGLQASGQQRMPIKVLIQCKALTGKGKISPHLIRELDGAFRGAPPGWKRHEDRVLGLLVTVKPATKGVMQAMRRSERAVGWLLIEDYEQDGKEESIEEQELERGPVETEEKTEETAKGTVMQILWNQKAKEVGLEGVDVVKRYDENGGEEVVLMYKGKIMDSA